MKLFALTSGILFALDAGSAFAKTQFQRPAKIQFQEPAHETTRPGANGMASIDAGDSVLESDDAQDGRSHATAAMTYTGQPLPPAPSTPHSIFVPQSPDQESFTQPDEDAELTAENVSFGDNDEEPTDANNRVRSATYAAQSATMNGFRPANQYDRPQPDEATHFSDEGFNPSRISQNGLREPDRQPDYEPSQLPSSQNFLAAPSQPSRQTFNSRPVDSTIRDPNVQPTTFNQVQPSQEPQTALAKELIGRYLVDNAPAPLPGQPTSLLDMLNQPIATSQRQKMVSQYWETWYDWSTLLSRADYVSWLNAVGTPTSPSDAAMLRASKSQAADQLLAAEIQLGKSQSKLMDYLPNQLAASSSTNPILPLPTDQPLIQKYRTNYEIYQSYSMIPARLRGIDTMLPKTLKLICDRATTVQLAQSAAENARTALANRQTDLGSVLEAGRIWRSAEQDLIASVTSYNQAIADYSLNVTNSGQAPEIIVAMLIGKPRSANATSPNLRPFQTAGRQDQTFGPGSQFQNSNPNSQPTQFQSQPRSVLSADAVSGQQANAGFDNRPAPRQFENPGNSFGPPIRNNNVAQQFNGGGTNNPAQPAARGPLQPRSANAALGNSNNEFSR